jgi:ferredoxin-NADP reductase/ferredoxin
VLQEGEVQAGDEITKLTSGQEAMTVAEMDGLLYLPRHPRHSLARALRIPALSDGWRESFQTLLDQGPDSGNQALNPAAGARPAWSGFHPFRVAGIDQESASVISIRLVPLEEVVPSAAQPGQFVTVRVRPDGEAAPLLRSYSLSGRPGGDGYRISVKREAHGTASGYLHTQLGVGDTLELAAPRGAFVLQPGDRPVVLVSAGVGATPVLAMLHALVEERPRRQVWWLHGARSRAEHSFAHEVDDLLARLPGAHRLVCYSNPGPRDRAGLDFDVRGHLTAQVLEDAAPPVDAAYYLCGPTPFMDEVGAALAAQGVTPERINVEVFGPSDPINPGIVDSTRQRPHPLEGPPGPGPEIWFSRSNLTVPWDPAFQSLLELAEACDVPVRWSCRSGVCHTCETGLVSGTVSYRPDPVEDAGPGNAYLCCSRPQTDVVLDL